MKQFYVLGRLLYGDNRYCPKTFISSPSQSHDFHLRNRQGDGEQASQNRVATELITSRQLITHLRYLCKDPLENQIDS
eukprot:scaffold363_cov56-Cylindrotheca_fusiformis.AAC.14